MIANLTINGVCTTIADGADSDHPGYTRITQYRPVRRGATLAQNYGEQPLSLPGATQPALAQHNKKPARKANYRGQGSVVSGIEIETLPMPSVTQPVRSFRSSSASAYAFNGGERPLELPALNFSKL